ncbi:MAG: hypothetical protein WBK76_01845 [Candidatus Saccharimonadales bacterium]
MNSANAFSYAVSGNYNESQMAKHAEYINQSAGAFQNAGGWLAEKANQMVNSFNTFLNSRAWEMGKRLLNNRDGEFVSRFEIGYLGSLNAQQNAQGFMRDYIMAIPEVMQGYLDGNLEGYGGEFSPLCTGVGEENIFYRRSMNGLLNIETVDDQVRLRHTHYHDSLGGELSFRERVDLQKTRSAAMYHLAETLFDVTSPEGNRRKNCGEVEM